MGHYCNFTQLDMQHNTQKYVGPSCFAGYPYCSAEHFMGIELKNGVTNKKSVLLFAKQIPVLDKYLVKNDSFPGVLLHYPEKTPKKECIFIGQMVRTFANVSLNYEHCRDPLWSFLSDQYMFSRQNANSISPFFSIFDIGPVFVALFRTKWFWKNFKSEICLNADPSYVGYPVTSLNVRRLWIDADILHERYDLSKLQIEIYNMLTQVTEMYHKPDASKFAYGAGTWGWSSLSYAYAPESTKPPILAFGGEISLEIKKNAPKSFYDLLKVVPYVNSW